MHGQQNVKKIWYNVLLMWRAGFLSVVAGTVWYEGRCFKRAKVCPKYIELILEINKTVIVASSWCSVLLYL
jgi:hypothetical protein